MEHLPKLLELTLGPLVKIGQVFWGQFIQDIVRKVRLFSLLFGDHEKFIPLLLSVRFSICLNLKLLLLLLIDSLGQPRHH